MAENNNLENPTAPSSLVGKLVMCGRCYAEVTEFLQQTAMKNQKN